MIESSEMRDFRDSLLLRHCLFSADDGLSCKEEATALDALYKCSSSGSKIISNFEKLVDELLLVLLEFGMLPSTGPVLF
jgi:hypothetical protein